MGFSDIGCYGGEIETPNLDRLAANGLRYSQFYNTARCSPSRASLLTGLHPHQTGIGILTYSNGPEGYAGNLNKSCVTVAEVLKQNNYRTYLSGKWHIASSLTEPTDAWPLQRGFDYFFGTIIGAGSFYHPNTLTRGNDNIEHEAENDPAFFYTDAISDQAVAYIRAAQASQPRHAVLSIRRLHRATLAAACARRGHRQIQGPVRRGLGQTARAAAETPGRRRHHSSELATHRPRSDPAAVDRSRAPRMDAALHGGLCRADRPHGPGHRPHRRRAGRDRPARQHADHLPVRQRRLRRGHSRKASPRENWSTS